MPPRKRLGQLLTELGVIDEHQLQSALGHQKQWGGKLGSVLVQKGFCSEPEMISALSQHLGMPRVRLTEAQIDPRAVKFVSKQIAEKLHVFPYEVSGSGRAEVVAIAMSDPTDLSAVDQLAFHTGKRIKPILAGDSEIIAAIQTHYGDEKKAAPAATPAAPPAPRPAAAGTPAPAAESSWRVSPPAGAAAPARPTPAAGTPAVAPAVAEPAPAAAAGEQQLEEIEPEESFPPAEAAAPVDLPADDGEVMGLEPIAAHSQFGDAVSGQEDISGEGSPVDAVEGLEPAGVPHQGAGEPAAEAGWGAEPVPAGEWTAAPEPAAEPAAEPDAGWTAVEPWTAEPAPAEAAAADTTGEELPVDAILGTAESAEAPDAWASSEDPLAAGVAGEEFSNLPEPPPEGVLDQLASPTTDKFALAAPEETSHEAAATETEAPPQWTGAEPEAAPVEEAPPEDNPALEGWVAPQEEPEPQATGWFGEALEGTLPLSAAEVGTLASVGVDPNDGVAALRLLAALVRVLNRRELLDLDEVAGEVRQGRVQAAREHAAGPAEAEPNGVSDTGQAEPSGELAAPADPAET